MNMTLERPVIEKLRAERADIDRRIDEAQAIEQASQKKIASLVQSADQVAAQVAEAQRLAAMRVQLQELLPTLAQPFRQIRANHAGKQVLVTDALRVLNSITQMQQEIADETSAALRGLDQGLAPFADLLRAEPGLYSQIKTQLIAGINPNLRFSVRPDYFSTFTKIFGIRPAKLKL